MNLTKLIQNYTPSEKTRAVVAETKIALLVGISGAGKETIKQSLLIQPGFGEIISHTTRQPRENDGVREQDGVDYHFIDSETAHEMLRSGEFLEAKLVRDVFYGTSATAVANAGRSGVAIADLDVHGIAKYKAVSDRVVALFIVPPTQEAWIQRLKRRYMTDEEFSRDWPRRLSVAIAELENAVSLPYYHFIINDDLSRAVEVAAEIASRDDVFTRKDDEARILARDLLQQIKM